MRVPLVYHPHPILGFDLGTRTAKLVQLQRRGKHFEVLGYASAEFPAEAIVEGIIVDPREIADALKPLLQHPAGGHLTATRVAASLPGAKVFTRVISLPTMNDADLAAAVRLEAEQYVPVPLPDLNIDFEIISRGTEQIEVLMVAAPRAIVDSYMKLFELMGLEVIFIESTLSSATRAILAAGPLTKTTLIADIGATSIDLTVYDQMIRLTDTVALGGDNLSSQLISNLGVTPQQAHEIKLKFGIADSGMQPKVKAALEKPLASIASEIKRVMKFYSERGLSQRPVEAIVLAGGSASMPGLSGYLAAATGVAVSVAEPWSGLAFNQTPKVSRHEGPLYTTAIGLARLEGSV